MLRKRVSNSQRSILQLGPECGEKEPNCIERVPISPTDVNLSPCTKQLCLPRKPSLHECKNYALQPRVWDTDSDETDDQFSSDDDSDEIATPVSQMEISGSFFNGIADLNLTPKAMPTDMPLMLVPSTTQSFRVLDILGWPYSLMKATSYGPHEPSSSGSAEDIVTARARCLVNRYSFQVQDSAILLSVSQILHPKGKCEIADMRGIPNNIGQTRSYLNSLSNSRVVMVTGLCVLHIEKGMFESSVDSVEVEFGPISEEIIEKVLERGDASGCAGGLCLFDPDVRAAVLEIEGSVDSLWGLPVDHLCTLLHKVA